MSVCPTPGSPEVLYARHKAAQWIVAALDDSVSLSSDFFECLRWICGDLDIHLLLDPLLKQTAHLRTRSGRTAHRALTKFLEENSPAYIWNCFDDLFEGNPCLIPYLSEQCKQLCRDIAQGGEDAGTSAPELFLAAQRRLKQIFGLEEDRARFCEFIFILQNFSEVESYFEDHLGVFRFGRERLFARILDMTPQQLSGCLRELKNCGLIENHHSSLRLIDSLLDFWSTDNVDPGEQFCRPLEGETLPLDAFRVPAEDVRQVCSLLKRQDGGAVHILLYGPSGTGKTTFVRSVARVCGLKAWTVPSRLDDCDRDRRASLFACLHMASRHEGSFVVVDEAERILYTDPFFERETKDKAWLNDFLEKPGQCVVWISNQVKHIDPAVRRRFSYSICFEELGLRERVEVWRQILKGQKLSRYFQEGRVRGLARNYPVQAAVIQKAVEQSHSLYPRKNDFYPSVERILRAHLALQHGDGSRAKQVRAVPEFTLDGVCMEGDAAALVERCRRVDAAMSSGQELRPGCGTMLFYGPPGTGKTALARFLADQMDRECLVKRASDLLNPFVGVSEEQVAEAFRHAEKSGAVLVIDEADTFLFSREEASHSWERSLVNEFLTSLEECRGFCICTTNCRSHMDAAAMRRFTCKVEFRYAEPDQVQALYEALLAPLCAEKLPEALRQQLIGMRGLTPGSFHAVRSQYDPLFTAPGEVTHELLLDALRRETELNLDSGQERRIGFVAQKPEQTVRLH
ncbi:ATP-binding protein [uncultured Mailhella sp.]|uniref:AAA family ATPase n=1 Tax=uncultured Mailhella sp. TaxID=1981031 RepID=UPI0026311704|nr:ATP-binding protein [uncultured Mailhella sp.]